MLYLIWLSALAATLYLYFRRKYTFFSRRGVQTFTPIPPVGTLGRTLLRKDHFTEDYSRLYNTFPNERFVGRYDFTTPILVVRDIELVKKMTVKDFEYFLDHRTYINEKTDSMFGRNLVALKGQEWKDMRSALSPAFTSSKIKLMVPFMIEIGEQMIEALKTKIEASSEGYLDLDIKDLVSRYANDVVASCAFGLKVDSYADENNQFFSNSKQASTFGSAQLIKILGYSSFPKFMEFFQITLFAEPVRKFYRNLVLSTIRHREEKNIVRPDMVHLLIEAKKGRLTHEDKAAKDVDAGFATVEESAVGKSEVKRDWSDNDLIAQAVVFLVAGFETVSSAMSFLLHELAVNPQLQERLAQEIRENDKINNGKFDYNSIQEMTYLDMVVSEVLRKWPAGAFLDRVCNKDYNCGRVNDTATEDYILPKGTALAIPVWAIHRDPQYYPDPEKFDPERFSEENKHKIKSFTYMPFGLGPRNCIGSRFALCEVKVLTYQFIQHMRVEPCAKTCIPAEIDKNSFHVKLKGGHWLRVSARD